MPLLPPNYNEVNIMIPYGVFYEKRLQETFTNVNDARKYVKRQLKDPNAEKDEFEVRLV